MNYILQAHTKESLVFDHTRLKRSIHVNCLGVGEPSGSAENIAHHVTQHVIRWLDNKVEVTAADIRRVAHQALSIYHPAAADLYEQENLIT